MEKWNKNTHSRQNSRACTGTGQSCTDTGQSCTGTGQSCTGTGSVLFFYFDQLSYFGHNLLISNPI